MTLFHIPNHRHHHFSLSLSYAVSIIQKHRENLKLSIFIVFSTLCKSCCLCSFHFRTNCLCHPAFTPTGAKPQKKKTELNERQKKSNQSHCREQKQFKADENYSHSTKTIVYVFFFFGSIKKSFSIESAFESFFFIFKHGENSKFECVGGFSPHFPCCWKENLFFFVRHRCVWQPENVYNHLKYITVEYTSLCQPHIFLPFSIITFSSMYFGDNFFCSFAEQCLPTSSMGMKNEKLAQNRIQQFKNWKIVLKECQKHIEEWRS